MAPAKSSPADATITESTPPSGGEPIAEKKLLNRGLITLLSISFLGAANDNILKQLLIFMVVAGGVWVNVLGNGTQSYIALVLAIPFIRWSNCGQIQ